MLKNIHRRKPIHSHSGQGNAVLLNDSEREEFEKQIEKLKQEKDSLQSELEHHKQEKESYEYKLRALGQTLQNIGQKQRHLLTTVAQLLQKSGYSSNVPEQFESQSKKRRLLALHYLQDEANRAEKQVMTFQEDSKPSLFPLMNMELVDKLESSINFWENFLHGINQPPSEELHGTSAPLVPSAVITEIPQAYEDSDLNTSQVPSCTPECHVSPSPSQDYHSSPDLAASSNYAESPPISSICVDLDSRHQVLTIDVNTVSKIDGNTVSTIDVNTEPTETPVGAITVKAAAANDVFWQQFLTDAQGTSMTQEVESERRELDDGRMDQHSGVADEHKPWWNVDKLSQQMGHLAQVERT